MNINATIIGQSIAFLVFVWFCMRYVWPPIIQVLDDRKKHISDGLQAAAEGRDKLANAVIQVEQEIQQARVKAQDIIQAANKRANGIIDKAKHDAEAVANHIKNTAQEEIQKEINIAKESLRIKIGKLSVFGAEKIILKNIDQSINEKLVDDLISNL